MMPSSGDLHYFQEVCHSLNLSRASERLGISQPSLTLAIQRLEHTVGTPLLIRSRKGVQLTQAGKQLNQHSKELLQRWEVVKGSALASVNEVQGMYTLGCHASVGIYALGEFLPDLLSDHPRLELKLHHDLSRRITESVVRMETDIGIVVNPVRHPDLMIRRLCEDEVTLWTGEGRRKVQDFRSGEAVLICDPDLMQARDLIKKLRKSGIGFRRILPTSNLELVTKLVESGAGIGIIPSRVVGRFAESRLRRIPRAPVFRDEISLLYRVENKGIRAIQTITERISRAFK